MNFHLYCMYSFSFLINILEEDRAHYCDVLKYVGVMNSKHGILHCLPQFPQQRCFTGGRGLLK